jgi:hypothetical protein
MPTWQITAAAPTALRMKLEDHRGVRCIWASLNLSQINRRLMSCVDQIHVVEGSAIRQQQLYPVRIRVARTWNRTNRGRRLGCNPDGSGRLELSGRHQRSGRDDSRSAPRCGWRADKNSAEQEAAKKRHDDQTCFLNVELHSGGGLVTAERPELRHAGPRAPSRVACSDLIGIVVISEEINPQQCKVRLLAEMVR